MIQWSLSELSQVHCYQEVLTANSAKFWNKSHVTSLFRMILKCCFAESISRNVFQGGDNGWICHLGWIVPFMSQILCITHFTFTLYYFMFVMACFILSASWGFILKGHKQVAHIVQCWGWSVHRCVFWLNIDPCLQFVNVWGSFMSLWFDHRWKVEQQGRVPFRNQLSFRASFSSKQFDWSLHDTNNN